MKQGEVLIKFRGGEAACLRGTWTVRRHEQWVVRGPNRAGKTYLGLVIAEELPPGGATLEISEEIENRISLVTFSQQEALAAGSWLQARWHAGFDAPAETVRGFLSFDRVHDINPYEVRGRDAGLRREFAARRCETVGLLGLGALFRRRMVQLSNGEIRKVLIARALLKTPELLILDDPFAGLDTNARAQLHQMIGTLAARGLPMIIMARRADEIPASTTHVLTLKGMRIIGKRRYTPKPAPCGKIPAWTRKMRHDQGGHGSPVIEMRDVTVRYGRRTLINRLCWTVRQGEKWMLIGPNGSGKTTLFSLVTGDNPAAYAHDIQVFDRPRCIGEAIWDVRHRIGHISPEIQCYFDEDVSVLEAALSGRFDTFGRRMPVSRADRASAISLLSEMGLERHAFARLNALSPGQARLVLIARALLPNPMLLLLDEPCLNLDTQNRGYVLRKLSQLFRTEDKRTVVCTAQHPDDIPRGVTHLLILDGGLGLDPHQPPEKHSRRQGHPRAEKKGR